MKKIVALSLFILAVSLLSYSAKENSKPILKFNPDGKFKIVQFTDVHFQYGSYRSDSALVIIKTVIAAEKPDLVVLTGDIVCSKNTAKAWISLSKVLIDAGIPWAVTLGNHDREYEMTEEQIMKTIVGMPFNLTENGPKKISGIGNYILEIQSSKSSKTEALLYCFDSRRAYPPTHDTGMSDWIRSDQINWYTGHSNKFTRANGGNPLPALAFFHIPLPEYKEIIGKGSTIGIQEETPCSSAINSGLYAAMFDSKDVMGVFVGHDHNDNYIGCLHNICLAYGNVTGRQCYGKIGRGARVIELYEGERKFDTWILKLYECDRDKDTWLPVSNCQPKFVVSYPDSFKENSAGK